jgi:NAD(P)-dependent dehydrogenase (short-subunit alcohol dehydrogenase family)
MSRAVLPGMLARGRGAIVNVASRAAFDRPAGLAAYSAAKAAIVVLTETLQREVAARGVRVNAVVPTTIDTPANRAAMPDADFSTWTRPEQIAAAVLWLASDAATAVRGALVPV